MLDLLKGANLVVAFLLELAMLGAFVVWALSLDVASWQKWLIAIVLVIAAVIIWGVWAAPRSELRLRGLTLVALQAVLFLLATLALWTARQPIWATVFGILAAINLVLAAVWGQEDAATG